MSNSKKHQIWCEIGIDKFIIHNNKELSQLIIQCLRSHHKRQIYQNVAQNIDENMYMTRNWFQKSCPVSAYHLLLLMREYDFIKDIVEEMLRNNVL